MIIAPAPRYKKIIASTAVLLVISLALTFCIMQVFRAKAAVVGWNAGNVISDSVFTNKSTMTVNEIQSFLNSKVPVCNTAGEEWGRKRYNQNSFICLKDYVENGRSAAQIIYDAAQTYSINPQVILVLLQKEQSLVTDTWPSNIQYRSATGYGCPDTAACDSQYYGLTNQINWAAKMFRAIMNDSPTWYTPYNLGNNYIQYNPNAACGGSIVNIENRATKALYNYTPYQPNQGALNAGWGMAPCGAYGNRNFYLYFTSWFDTVTIPPTVYLPNGVYTLSGQASSKSMDVLSASVANGASVGIYTNNNTSAQRWMVKQESDGYYSLTNVNSGKALDVTGGSANTGTKLQTYASNSTCAQRWSIVSDNSGVSLLNKCSSLAADVAGGSTANGARLQTWRYNGTSAQKWDINSHESQQVTNGVYTISSAASNLALDITNANLSNGARIQIWNKNNSPAQQWQVTRQPDGFYTIYNPASSKYLDVLNANRDSGADIQIFSSTNSCAQKWAIQRIGSNLSILSACSGKALDIRGGLVSTPGTKIQLYTANNSGAQLWNFTEVVGSAPQNGTYSLVTPSSKALDITNGNLSNGTKLQIWNKNNSPAQRWQITRQLDGFYTIYNPASSKYLDVKNGRIATGTAIQIYTGNKSCAQRWSIVGANNVYNIQSACSVKLSLDVTNGIIGTNGTSVQLYYRNSSSAQRWLFTQ